jgi:hypothetical protein
MPGWLVTTSILALGLTVYGVATRAWFLAAGGQLFIFVGVVQFAWQVFQGNAPWQYPLAPIVANGLAVDCATLFWFAQKPQANPRVREPLLQIALIYRWFGLAMSIAWICQYIPARERIWVLGCSALGSLSRLVNGEAARPCFSARPLR